LILQVCVELTISGGRYPSVTRKAFTTPANSLHWHAPCVAATWCGPCKMIGPVFEQLSTKVGFEAFYEHFLWEPCSGLILTFCAPRQHPHAKHVNWQCNALQTCSTTRLYFSRWMLMNCLRWLATVVSGLCQPSRYVRERPAMFGPALATHYAA